MPLIDDKADTGQACPGCGYQNPAETPACGLCGAVLVAAPVRDAEPEWTGESPDYLEEVDVVPLPGEDLREIIAHMTLGLCCAPLLLWAPFFSTMGWFLGALFHEVGHSVVAWFFGMPAFPAIRIDGHAASVHDPQITWLAWGICLGLGALAWSQRGRPAVAVSLGVGTLLHPVFAFTWAGELLHLVGGHLGELAMATVCFWRTFEAGFTESKAERALYATVGWFLVLDHLLLAGGLAVSAGVRWKYANNGSFGLTNDYIRVSEDVLHGGLSLAGVGGVMALITLLPLPLAWWIWRHGRRAA